MLALLNFYVTSADAVAAPVLAWMPGTFEWVIIGVVALVVFGPKKLPQIGQAVGKSLREFKQAAEGIKDEFNEAAKTADKKTSEHKSPYETPSSSQTYGDGYGAPNTSASEQVQAPVEKPVEITGEDQQPASDSAVAVEEEPAKEDSTP